MQNRAPYKEGKWDYKTTYLFSTPAKSANLNLPAICHTLQNLKI